ncbi:OmpA family protein [Yoonia sp.]|uniref:OmpA family protein n=1 Tax=Yoonia sp. TaxID=2212373 RepID=UPI0019E61F32|nr:OmpA family protein [Yoonia sp.]MBE0412036.1 OmpA family protein [Yoonia sp.]
MIFFRLCFLCTLATAVDAQTLAFPGNASLQRTETQALDSYVMPVGVWNSGIMPTQVVEGQVTQQAWRIPAAGLTTLQLLRPLREQLRNDGYRVIFECQTEACGGFDFRFGIDMLPPPEMQINIGDFRFLAAERSGDAGIEYVNLFASRTAQAGFVQVTIINPAGTVNDVPPLPTPVAPQQVAPLDQASLAAQLDSAGHAVLADLRFAIGSAQLDIAEFASLRALADYLQAHPDRTVVLVGHTDAVGALEPNIALSKRRAGAVLNSLVADYGVSRGQLAAEGAGYLAPIATNATEQGRDTNRRVEVVLTSTVD